MTALGSLVWITSDNGMTLTAASYPISIERTTDPNRPFLLHLNQQTRAFWTLDGAKADAERMAHEINEFTPKPPNNGPNL